MTDLGTFKQRIRGRGFEPNHREFGLHIRSEVARKPAVIVATEIAEKATAAAPRGDRRRTDEFSPGVRRRTASTPLRVKKISVLAGGNRRASAEAYSISPSFVKAEFGTKYQRPQHTLLRAAVGVMAERGIPFTDLRGEDDDRG